MRSFLQNRKKKQKQKYVRFVSIEPIKIQTLSAYQNDHLNFNFVKDIHVVGKIKRPFISRKLWLTVSKRAKDGREEQENIY